jgi:WD40 repeat protein
MKLARPYLLFTFCLLSLICVSQTNTKTHTPSVILSKTLTGQTNPISAIAYSPDGKYIASGSRSINVFSPSGDYEIIIWNNSVGEIFSHLKGHKSPITSLSYDKRGKRIVSSDQDGEILIWNTDSMKVTKRIKGGDLIRTICFTPDGKFIIGEYSYAKLVGIWDSETGNIVATFPIDIQIGSMDISPDGTKIALACYKKIQIWSLISRKLIISIDEDSSNGFGIKYSKDGENLAVGLGNGEIKLFESINLKLKYTFQGHFKPVLSISFSKDNKLIVSGSSDQMIKLWDLNSKKEIKSLLNEHKGTVNAVDFSPVSNTFATAGDDKKIHIWKIK